MPWVRIGNISGKDAVVPDVAALVATAVAALPVPTNGRDGRDGVDGASVDPAVVEAIVTTHVAKAVSALPAPRDGKDGKDGRDVDPASLELVVSAHVEKAIAAIPVPKDGKDGAAGADGRSVTLEDVAPFIAKAIEERVAALPAAKDGIGFTGAVINREGHLVLTRSDGTTQDAGFVIGKDGAPGLNGKDGIGIPGKDGIDGKDGLGFDDFDLTLDESRGWILRLAQGERVKETPIPLPFFMGNWEAGKTYPKAAGVRWDGHYWWALKQTVEQPGDGSTAWQIVVSRGKQGKEGQRGKDGAPGRDLTQIDPANGRKW